MLSQVYNLSGLEEMLKKAYRSVTEGKFNDALSRFNALLHIIPLLVVDTRREVDDVKELLCIAKCVLLSEFTVHQVESNNQRMLAVD